MKEGTDVVAVDLRRHKDAILLLMKDIKKKMNHEEFIQLPLRGVQDLEKKDLETTALSIQYLVKNGGSGFQPLPRPVGKTKELFEAYGIMKSN